MKTAATERIEAAIRRTTDKEASQHTRDPETNPTTARRESMKATIAHHPTEERLKEKALIRIGSQMGLLPSSITMTRETRITMLRGKRRDSQDSQDSVSII
jgi:hypothetical protein